MADYVRTMLRLRELPARIIHAGHEPSFGRERLIALADAYLEKAEERLSTRLGGAAGTGIARVGVPINVREQLFASTTLAARNLFDRPWRWESSHGQRLHKDG